MKTKNIKQKAEAIRLAVHEVAERVSRVHSHIHYRSWLGQGLKAPLRLKRKFLTEDDLWL